MRLLVLTAAQRRSLLDTAERHLVAVGACLRIALGRDGGVSVGKLFGDRGQFYVPDGDLSGKITHLAIGIGLAIFLSARLLELVGQCADALHAHIAGAEPGEGDAGKSLRRQYGVKR